MHARNELFLASKAPTTKQALGVDAKSIVDDRKSWSSTKPHEFSSSQLGLLQVLLSSEDEQWGNLWMVCLLRAHMVSSNGISGKVLYVLGARAHSVALMELSNKDGSYQWAIDPSEAAMRCCVPVTSLDQFRVHEYTLHLSFHNAGVRVGIELVDLGGQTMARHNFIQYLRLQEC